MYITYGHRRQANARRKPVRIPDYHGSRQSSNPGLQLFRVRNVCERAFRYFVADFEGGCRHREQLVSNGGLSYSVCEQQYHYETGTGTASHVVRGKS